MHIYSVLVGKEMAMILKWNRMGMIMTEPIRYNTSSHLVEIFCCYSQALPAMCGMDQPVSDPTPTEGTVARCVLELDNTAPLVKLKIPRAGHASDYFIISTPRATPCTSQYWHNHMSLYSY